jgi:hypothetical protein
MKAKTIVQEAIERKLLSQKQVDSFWDTQYIFRKIANERKAKKAKKLSTIKPTVKVDKKAR